VTLESPPATLALKPTLLIVDDEEGPRQSLKIVFKHEYQVRVAASGREALEIARAEPIDVAVLDIMMFGMNGVELLKELKEIDPSIEVVMLTAFETLETARQALRNGASDYLNKPFDIPTMRAAVARAAARRQATIEVQSTQDQLQHLQLEIQQQRIQEEIARTKGDIYASVLHDINSPLTVISGFVELINRAMQNSVKVEGEQLEHIKTDLKNLSGQVGRCFEISRRYLGFLNTSSSDRTYVGVRQMLADLKDLLVRHPSAHGNQLLIHELSPDVTAEINGTDLLQILLNLTINALQSTDTPHQVEITCQPIRNPLDLSQYVDGPGQRFVNREGFLNRAPLLAVTIADNGPGIAPEVLARMFVEKFTTKPSDRGTGLGLSIVLRLVREAKAAIHLRSEVGKGSWFTILLQVHE
jgi:two-component system, sensor histidine kinase and response regulator